MSGLNHIKDYLAKNMVQYSIWPDYSEEQHSCAFLGTVKSILLKIDDKYAIMVLKNKEYIDIERTKMLLNAKSIRVVQDDECRKLFPDCDTTALPILGSLVNMDVYCSANVIQDQEICFNPGTHNKVVKVYIDDFVNLEHPKVDNYTKYGYKESKYEFVL